MSNHIQEHLIALNTNMAKEKLLSEEELKRKETLRRRMFWMLVGFDVLLVVYLIIQIALIVK